MFTPGLQNYGFGWSIRKTKLDDEKTGWRPSGTTAGFMDLRPCSQSRATCNDSLGESYAAAGMRELALTNYRKSLELDPKDTNAKEFIERLEKSAQAQP